jgi:transposase
MILPKGASFSSQNLDHLGLVAGTINQLGIVEEIDKLIPLQAKAKTTIGQRVAAMILNGLGFVDDRLYLFPKFLENKPVSRLLGNNLIASDFNDDCIGRGLDEIHNYGISNLFGRLAFNIGLKHKLLGKSMHTDTTSLTVYGEYAATEDMVISTIITEEKSQATQLEITPKPEYGHAKNKRFDLKQMVLTLATTGSSGFPVWMESHSGNASDARTLQETAQRIQGFCKTLEDCPSFLYVGDSAMYNNCVRHGNNLLWLSRVPEQVKLAKELLANNNVAWDAIDKNYKYYAVRQRHNNVLQRWLLVFSQHAYDKEMATLNRNIAKECDLIDKALWHLSNQEFTCSSDATKSLDTFNKKWKYHTADAKVLPIEKHAKSGRPGKDEKPTVVGYQIVGGVLQNQIYIEQAKMTKGKFILATNQLDETILSNTDMLLEYKEQSHTESGFKFIKDDTFEVSSVFLKKPERISALMMVMTLCLMVYSFAQYMLRNALLTNDEAVENQTGKPTNKPSMKWVYRLFLGISIIRLQLKNQIQELVSNVTEELERIIKYFGVYTMQIYDISFTE